MTGGGEVGVVEAVRARLRTLAAADRIGQFVSVGVAGATLETVVVAVLTAGLAVQPLPAKFVGAEASITLMFLLNDRWTFAGEGGAGNVSRLRRYVKSHTVRLGGLAVAFGTLYVLTSWTDVELLLLGRDFWPTVANVIAIGAGMSLNYVAESLITWRVHDSR